MVNMVRTTFRGILWKGWLLLLAAWLVCSYRTGNPGNPHTIRALYNKANRLFRLANPTDATDSLALATFQQVIALAIQVAGLPTIPRQ